MKKRILSHKHKHHIAITVAVAIASFAHLILPVQWEHLSPLTGFLASTLWIWSE